MTCVILNTATQEFKIWKAVPGRASSQHLELKIVLIAMKHNPWLLTCTLTVFTVHS